MSVKGIFTRGFGVGLGSIKDIVLRGFTPNPEPPKLGDPIDYTVLSVYFMDDEVSAIFEGGSVCQ